MRVLACQSRHEEKDMYFRHLPRATNRHQTGHGLCCQALRRGDYVANPAPIAASVLLLLSAVALGQRPSAHTLVKPLKMGQADANTFVGLVSDSNCGPRHKLRDKSAEECTRTCQRAGAAYVLVAGEKIYRLKGDSIEVGVLAGQKAKVTGRLQGNTITVDGIAPTQ